PLTADARGSPVHTPEHHSTRDPDREGRGDNESGDFERPTSNLLEVPEHGLLNGRQMLEPPWNVQESDGDDTTQPREAVHLPGQVSAIARIESEREADQCHECVAYRQGFDQDAAIGRVPFHYVDAAKRSGILVERNLRRFSVNAYL